MPSKSERTHLHILETTRLLLEKSGGSQLRMSDIAKAADVSRQSLYIHFKTRTDLLVEVVRHGAQKNNADKLLVPVIAAPSGRQKIELFVAGWLDYIPQVYNVYKVLRTLQETDTAAKSALDDRFSALRTVCQAIIQTLEVNGQLRLTDAEEATDLLCQLLSVENWEHATIRNKWSQQLYKDHMLALMLHTFVCDDLS